MGSAAAMQEASNQLPEIVSLMADTASPQETGAIANWTAEAKDPDGDQVFYRFFLDDEHVTEWTAENNWTWAPSNAGSYRIEAQVRGRKHAGPNRNG